jgi:hypothetical protein
LSKRFKQVTSRGQQLEALRGHASGHQPHERRCGDAELAHQIKRLSNPRKIAVRDHDGTSDAHAALPK